MVVGLSSLLLLLTLSSAPLSEGLSSPTLPAASVQVPDRAALAHSSKALRIEVDEALSDVQQQRQQGRS